MYLESKAFSLPKAGNSLDEYEDAFYAGNDIHGDAETASFAVADGATEASFSDVWARLLVKAYCRGLFRDDMLPRLQKIWGREVGKKPLPWFAEEKVRQGAFSSIIGLTLREQNNVCQWDAIAIGDSCLFQIRREKIIKSFPLQNSAEFNSRPALLSSNLANNKDLDQSTFRVSGDFKPDDAFYLMTDAIACWFLAAAEKGEKPWEIIRNFETEDQIAPFPVWIDALRRERKIRNDDVTLLRIDIL